MFSTSLVSVIKSRWLESFFAILKGTRWRFVIQVWQNSKDLISVKRKKITQEKGGKIHASFIYINTDLFREKKVFRENWFFF